jgi:hypothetical protein
MLHSSDTLIATDPATLVDLCFTAEKQVYLSFRRHTPHHCFLPSPYRVERNAHKLPPLGWPKFSLTAAFLPRR